jgi:hypothetical protein
MAIRRSIRLETGEEIPGRWRCEPTNGATNGLSSKSRKQEHVAMKGDRGLKKKEKKTGFPVIHERKFPSILELIVVYLLGIASIKTCDHLSEIYEFTAGCCRMIKSIVWS